MTCIGHLSSKRLKFESLLGVLYSYSLSSTQLFTYSIKVPSFNLSRSLLAAKWINFIDRKKMHFIDPKLGNY